SAISAGWVMPRRHAASVELAGLGPINALLLVETFEHFLYLRMANRLTAFVPQQILFGDIGNVLGVLVLGEQMIEGLILAGTNVLRYRQPPFLAVGESRIDVENYPPKGKETVSNHFTDLKLCGFGECRHRV